MNGLKLNVVKKRCWSPWDSWVRLESGLITTIVLNLGQVLKNIEFHSFLFFPFLRQDKFACCSGWFQTCNSLALASKLLGWLQVHATAPRHIHQFLKNFNYTFKNLQKPVAAHQFCWRLPTWHCDSVVCAEASMTLLIALPHDSWVMRITDSVGITFNCHLQCLYKDYIVIWHNIRLLLVEKVCRAGCRVI